MERTGEGEDGSKFVLLFLLHISSDLTKSFLFFHSFVLVDNISYDNWGGSLSSSAAAVVTVVAAIAVGVVAAVVVAVAVADSKDSQRFPKNKSNVNFILLGARNGKF